MDDELNRYLASLERSSKFRVIRVLKSTPHETTELVELLDGVSMPGPYIRKSISLDAGMGQAYSRLYEEQQSGKTINAAPYIYECFQTEDTLTVVMEYVQGKTLADLIYEQDPSPVFAAHVFPRICDAVSELHEVFNPPIIHRDLKPSNIMVNEHGIKVIDFGIARTYREDAESDTNHFGTPSYAPPEQFGFGQTDERSDIYALGMLLYYCLTERTPTFAMLDSEFADNDVPVLLRAVITKATSFDPAHRYASVRDLNQAFLDAMDGKQNLVAAEATPEQEFPPQGVFPDDGFTPKKATAREILSMIWNAIVILAWLLMLAVCGSAGFAPGIEYANYPIWFTVLEYFVFLGGCFTFIAYALIYKKYFRYKLPRLFPFKTAKTWVICGIGAVASFGIALVFQTIGLITF